MATTQTKDWKEFQNLVENIQKYLSPKAKIKQSEKIKGKISNTTREVDIAIRHNIGQFDLFIAIECKYHKRKVDLPLVEAFHQKLEDIGAHKGAIVSYSGFTKSAAEFASRKMIQLFLPIDTENLQFNKFLVSIPAICDFRNIKTFQLQLSSSSLGPFKVPTSDPKLIKVYDENKTYLGTTGNLLRLAWNENRIPNDVGIYKDIKLSENPTLIECEGQLYAAEISATVEVQANIYFGYCPLDNTRGFMDQSGKKLATKSMEFGIDNEDVMKNWKQIPSIENAPTAPFIVLRGSDVYPIMESQIDLKP